MKEMEKLKKEQHQNRQVDSQNAFESWKVIKDREIRTNKTLYKYKEVHKKIHERAWCPARSMQYSYPLSEESKKSELSIGGGRILKSGSRILSPITAYSMDSFSSTLLESEKYEEEVDHSDKDGGRRSERSTKSSSGNSAASAVALTGEPKTIQVCCQTLHYWCTCEETH